MLRSVINTLLFVFLVVWFFGCDQAKEVRNVDKKREVIRERFDSQAFPELKAVGTILSKKRACSAILVAEDIIVTAGHCLASWNVLRGDKVSETMFHTPDERTKVVFRASETEIVGIYRVKRVVKANIEPDFAILQLTQKVPEVIRPMRLRNLSLEEFFDVEKTLGCAGYNGDKGLGRRGQRMTISRNVRIIRESSTRERIDVNCISTDGGSGGLLFTKSPDPKTGSSKIEFAGVIWGVVNDELDEDGKFIRPEKVITSITPTSVFYEELTTAISLRKKRGGDGKSGTENQKE